MTKIVPTSTRTARLMLAAVLLLAFALRLGFHRPGDESAIVDGGYHFYIVIADSFLDGNGLCYFPGKNCALRVPFYPLLIAPLRAAGWLYPGVMILQAAAGAALAWVAYAIARRLFDHGSGLIAAILTGFTPYSVIHDTAFQDTVWLNLFAALAVLLLMLGRGNGPPLASLAGGLALGLCILTATRIVFFLPCAVLWAIAAAPATWTARLRTDAVVAAPIVILAGGWMVRNWQVVGTPVLTTEGGEALWGANNSATFSHFPNGSIDQSFEEAYRRLTAEERATLTSLKGNSTGAMEVAKDRILAQWAYGYIAAHPFEALWSAVRKLWVVISGQLSPWSSSASGIGYYLVFVPLHALALVSVWRTRKQWAAHSLVYIMLLSFLATVSMFWAHTSHKSLIDPFVFVYAGAAIKSLLLRWV